MEDQRPPRLEDISHLIDVNTEYHVFLCPVCRNAFQPGTFTDHLLEKHKTPLDERKQVQAYIKGTKWIYTLKTLKLPKPMSRPQPLLRVIDAFECKLCVTNGRTRPFITHSERVLRNHGNLVHQKSWAGIPNLGRSVRVQSWSRGGGTERYWPVDEPLEDSGGDRVGTRQTVTTQADNLDVRDATQEGDFEVIGIDSDTEATIFVDSRVIVVSSDESDNEVLVPRKRAASPVGDHVEGGEYIAVADNDEDDELVTTRPRKIRRRPAFEDRVGSGFDPEDSQEPVARPSAKLRKVAFVDSGAVMGSSQDGSQDEGFPASSPPEVWIVDSGSDGAECVAEGSTRVAPTPVFVGAGVGQRRSVLEVLQDRLDEWCQACPVCVLAQDCENVLHQVGDCWREDAAEVAEEAERMQRHIEEYGGFIGKDGCPWCGVPRVICNRWRCGQGGSWGIVDRQACQFLGALVVAVNAMMLDGSGEGYAVAQEWMIRGRARPSKPVEVFEWFRGAAEEWKDIRMEVPRILWVFDMLVNKNRGVGKI